MTKTPRTIMPHTSPPDIGFRVMTLESMVDQNDHHAMLWTALLEIGDDAILQARVEVIELKVTEEKFTITQADYASVYYIGEKPRYRHIACFAQNIAPSVAMYLLCVPTDALILRECAVTAEMADILRLVHTGLHRTVSVYMYCPEGCTTCKQR